MLGNTVMHQLMAIQPQWRLTVYMGKTAGLIVLGGCGGQIYGQYFRASNSSFKLLCNEIESFFVLITKSLHPHLFNKWTSFCMPPDTASLFLTLKRFLSVLPFPLSFSNLIHHHLPTNCWMKTELRRVSA